MICPHHFLGPAMDRMGPALVSSSARRRILDFAASLPDLASGHILECRLNGDDACDYSQVLTRGDGQFSAFRAGMPKGPGWTEMQAVFGQLDGKLADAALIWLEFDAMAEGQMSPPSVFLAPSTHSSAGAMALASAIVETCGLRPAPDLHWFRTGLSDKVTIKQIGVMLGRGSSQLRLVCDGIVPNEMRAFLGYAGWTGLMPDAEALIGLTNDLVGTQPCRMDIDLGEVVGPGLGIEIPFHLIGDISNAAERLQSAGLCCRAAADGFCGAAPRRDLMPSDGSGARTEFGLNHLKLGLPSADAAPLAKAYFSLLTLPDFRPSAVAPDVGEQGPA